MLFNSQLTIGKSFETGLEPAEWFPSILSKLDVCPSDRSYLVHFARSTPSPLTRLPSGALRSAEETGEWGRNADTDVYAPHGIIAAAAARITAV